MRTAEYQRDSDSSSSTRAGHSPGGRRSTAPALVRSLVVVVLLALWLGIGGVGGMRQAQLSELQDNDVASFLPVEAESTRAAEYAEQFRESNNLPLFAVLTRDDGEAITDEQFAALQDIAEAYPQREIAPGLRAEDALTSPVIALPAEDGAAMMLLTNLDADISRDTYDESGNVATILVEDMRELLAEQSPAGMTAWVTGPGGYVADLTSSFAGIDGVLLIVALVVVLIILIIVYRSLTLPIMVLLTAVFALALAGFIVYELAAREVLVLSGQTQGILSILVVGAATDYCLLIVARYREYLGIHQSPWSAMTKAIRACIPPIAASAGTVIVGLLCLLLSDLATNASLGPVGAIGIASSVLASLTLLPALLMVGGKRARWIFWPRVPRAGDHHETAALGGIWGRVARFVGRHARPVWISTAIVLAAFAAFLPTFRAEGTSQSDIFLQPTESVEGEEILDQHFEVGGATPATVITTPERYEDVIAAAEGTEGVESAEVVREDAGPAGMPQDAGASGGAPEGAGPPPGVAEGAPEGAGPPPGVAEGEAVQDEAPIIEIDGRVLVEVATDAPAETTEGVDAVREVRAAVHEADPQALVGGQAAASLDTQEVARSDLMTIIPVVLVVILVMLMILLRSVVAPVVLLLANVLSFAATMGLAALVFNHVFDFPGADAVVPLQAFVFLVALSIDYSIFLMTRAREESLQHGTRRGVLRALAVTGGVITSAGLVLAATFSALVVIPLLFMAQLAFIVAVGVIIDTFLVRSLLVAGLSFDLGDKSWWPFARPMRQASIREQADTL